MAKKAKVEKVAKETGVETQDLNRLPEVALDKLDALVPDEELLGNSQDSVVTPANKKLIGYHPITGVEIWE